MHRDQYPDKVIATMNELGCAPKIVLWTAISAMGFDDFSKTICVVYNQYDEPSNPKIINYSDIVKVELLTLQDIRKEKNGAFSGGVLGFAMAGPVGMVVGSKLLNKTETKTVVRGYELRVVVNDIECPIYSVDFGTKKEAEYWYGVFLIASQNSRITGETNTTAPKIRTTKKNKNLTGESSVIAMIAEKLKYIQEEGKSCVIFSTTESSGNYYIQFSVEGNDLQAEAVSNKNLEDNYKLTKTKISKLIQMGWSLDKKITDNYIRKMRANTDEERSVIAEEVVLAFVEVYGTSNADSIETTLVT